MRKVKRMFKLMGALKDFDLEAYKQGKTNFEKPNKEVEVEAQKRAIKCLDCDLIKEEVLDELKEKTDSEKIKELKHKYCSQCECVSSYLVRQNIKICKKW